MSTVDAHIEDTTEAHAGHDAGHTSHKDSYYVIVALILAVVTGIEVAISYVDIGALFMPTLLILMVFKFFTVVLVFMHLKFDHKLFGTLFYMGLGLAIAVYIGTLMTFRFFDS